MAEPWRGDGENRSFVLSKEDIDGYLQHIITQGCVKGTVGNYRRSLRKFYNWLPPDKKVYQQTASEYQHHLAEQYMPSTVNLLTAPINGLLGYLGLREYQVTRCVPPDRDDVQPELSRTEYLRLLSAAKGKSDQRLYLLVKLFATTGIAVQEVSRVTREAVTEGKIVTFPNHNRKELRIPPCVQQELLEYAREKGIKTGPLFLSGSGKPIHRTAIYSLIQRLSRDARVEENKCNPRCLQKLYDKTQETIRANVAVMLQMTYDSLLEREQAIYGWEDLPQRA